MARTRPTSTRTTRTSRHLAARKTAEPLGERRPIVSTSPARRPGGNERRSTTRRHQDQRNAPGWTWKANGRDNDNRFDFLVIEHLEYGAGPPLHFHTTFEDSFFVLDGLVTAQLGDDIVELGPGDFATAPPGVAHSFTNAHADQGACRAINLLTPGVGFDRYIDQIDKLAAKGDTEGIERLNAEYDVTVVGPSVAERIGLNR